VLKTVNELYQKHIRGFDAVV